MKEKPLKTASEDVLQANRNEAIAKKIELELLRRKLQKTMGLGFRQIEVQTFEISDYLVSNRGKRN